MIVRSEHGIVRLERDEMIRGRDCVPTCDFFFLFSFMSEKSVLTKKSQKKKLICVFVYVWVYDFFIFLFWISLLLV